MKKASILITLTLAFLYLTLQSSNNGITGQSVSGCTCHGTQSGTTSIEIDSAGIPVTNVIAGHAYTINVTFTPPTGYKYWGIDFKPSAGVASPTTGYKKSGVEITHSSPRGGITTTSYTHPISWTAPATSGSVTFTYGMVAGTSTNTTSGPWQKGSYTFNVNTAGPSNIVPSYTLSSPQALALCQDAPATDIQSLLHVSDADASQTETWTQQVAPNHGTLVVTSATASSGSTNITPGGTLTYQPTPGYNGADAFTVRVSDGTSTSDMVVNVTVNATPIMTVTPTSQSVCNNANTSTQIFSSSVSGTTFVWSNNNPSIGIGASGSGSSIASFTATNTNSTPAYGLFTVTPTANSCVGPVQNFTITVNPTPAMTVTPTSQTICNNANTTTESFTSNLAGTTYAWSNNNVTIGVGASGAGSALAPFTATNGGTTVSSGIFTVTPTSNSCVGPVKIFTLSVNPTPVMTVSTTSQTVCNNANTSVQTFTSNVAGTTYAWNNNNSTIGIGASGTGSSITSFTATNTGTVSTTGVFTVVPTASSCVGATKTFSVTVNPSPVITSNPMDATIVSGNDTLFSVVAGGGGLTYQWKVSTNGGASFSNLTNTGIYTNVTSPTLNLAGATTAENGNMYECVVSGTCSPAATSAAAILTVGPANITPTYTQTNPQVLVLCKNASVTDLKPLLHVSDLDPSQTETWTAASAPTHGTLVVTSATASSGAANITPGGTITYQPTVGYSGIDAFTVRVSDGISIKDMVVNVNVISVSTSVSSTTNISCNGLSNGAATISATAGTAPYTFSWSPVGGSSATASGLAPGTYSVSVTDANLCATTQTVTITQPAALTASVSATTNVSCNGGSNGHATVTVGGGTPSYIYSWAPGGGTGATATGLAAGSYTVTINDANSCSSTKTVTVTQPTALSSTVSSVTNLNCNGGTNGAATVSVSGGTPNYSFSWAPTGGNASSATLLAAGSYTVTIEDANSCTITQSVTVTQPAAITSSVSSQNNVDCNGNATGAVTITASGGTGTLTYSWAPAGGTLATATGLTAGTYSCTITDANFCMRIQTVTITQPAELTTTISAQTDVICHVGNNGAATILPTGGTAPYTYSWSPVGGAGATATGFTVGSYTCTVTDNHGCMHDQSVNIAEPALPTAFISGTTSICKDDSADLIINGPAGTVVSYTINGGALQNALMNASGVDTISSGSLTADVTYALVSISQGTCNYPSTGSAVITVKPIPSVDATIDQSVCNGATITPVIFTGTVPGTLFTWTNDNTTTGIPATASDSITAYTLTNTNTSRVFSTIIVTPSVGGCVGVSDTFVISSNPTPALTSAVSAPAVCNTTLFSYIPGSATAGTTYAWSRAVVSGISNAAANGNDDPNETLTNTTPVPVVVTYVYTLTANSCSNVQDVTVTVQPTPLLSSTLTPAAICNNTTFNYTPTSATTGTVYNWSRAAVTGIANTAAIGNDDPNEVLTNTTTDPIVVTYVYTLTANNCNHTENVTVTVNPTPILTSTLTVTPVCDSSLFSYTPTSATLGTTYNWSRSTVTGISNAANTGVDDPQEYLVNTTPDPVNVIYVYTLTANGCNNVQGVATTVYPKPLLSTTLTPAAICDSTLFTYTPASLTTGTTFVWSRAAVAGISNPANADNTDPAEVLDNTTTDPIAVTYVYTLTANGCTHTQNVVVVVDPTPILTSTLTPAPVCDSTLFSYMPTSATPGTAYNWTRAAVAGISNASGAGIDNPMEYLVNTTPDPITVTYVYTLTANGCSHVQSVSVVVNPKPLLTTTLTPPAICDSTLFSYTPASATVGIVFTWSRATVAGIANTAANGSNDPMEYLDNTTANPLTVVYIDTLLANGCYNTQTVSVVVNSTPMLSSALNAGSVCNNTTFNYTPTSATTGTTFAWTRDAVAGITNAAGSGTNNPAEVLNNNTNHQVTVTYVYTLTANGCSNTQVVTMTVNPTPVLSSTLTTTVCSSTPLVYTPGSTTTGTTFAWTRASVAGISNAAGASTGSAGLVNETLVNTTLFPVNVTYHYTLTAFGCSNSQNVTATVNPAPQPPVIAINSPSSVCSGTLYQNFGAANPPTDSVIYTWSATGAIVYAQGQSHTNSLVNFLTAGNADVILTANIHGISCYTADTFHVSISSATALEPEVYYIHDHFICTNNTVDSYQWGYDDASTLDSAIYTGQVDQNFYQVSPDFTHKLYWVITTKGGCSSKSYYNAPTGVTQIGNSEIAAINVFPNPTHGLSVIKCEGQFDVNLSCQLTIISMDGRVMSNQMVLMKDMVAGYQINASAYAAGT